MSVGDQKDIDAFNSKMTASLFGSDSANDPTYNTNNNTVFQQLDTGNPVSRSVAHIKTGPYLSTKKAVTNGAEASKSLSAGKQEVAAKVAAMKTDWQENKAEAVACLKEAGGENAVAQICPSENTGNSGLGSLVTSNIKGSSLGFEPSKQDKNLKPDEIKALIADTVQIAQSGGAKDTRALGGGDTAPKGDIAKLNESGMAQLLTQSVEDQAEYQAALDIGCALDNVAQNHKYVARNYNPTDVAESKYDSTDVNLTSQALHGISAIKLGDNMVAANEAHFHDNIADISPKLLRANIDDDTPVYKPAPSSINTMLGIS